MDGSRQLRQLEQLLTGLSAQTVKERQKALIGLKNELGHATVVQWLNTWTESEEDDLTEMRVTWPDIVRSTLGYIAKEAERQTPSKTSKAGDGVPALLQFIAAANAGGPMLTKVLVRSKETGFSLYVM